jgi:hypothetical protein
MKTEVEKRDISHDLREFQGWTITQDHTGVSATAASRHAQFLDTSSYRRLRMSKLHPAIDGLLLPR